VREAAELLGLSERAVHKRLNQGRMAGQRDGWQWAIARSEIDRLLSSPGELVAAQVEVDDLDHVEDADWLREELRRSRARVDVLLETVERLTKI
jgi:excisionase family DNA binding protein